MNLVFKNMFYLLLGWFENQTNRTMLSVAEEYVRDVPLYKHRGSWIWASVQKTSSSRDSYQATKNPEINPETLPGNF